MSKPSLSDRLRYLVGISDMQDAEASEFFDAADEAAALEALLANYRTAIQQEKLVSDGWRLSWEKDVAEERSRVAALEDKCKKLATALETRVAELEAINARALRIADAWDEANKPGMRVNHVGSHNAQTIAAIRAAAEGATSPE